MKCGEESWIENPRNLKRILNLEPLDIEILKISFLEFLILERRRIGDFESFIRIIPILGYKMDLGKLIEGNRSTLPFRESKKTIKIKENNLLINPVDQSNDLEVQSCQITLWITK